MIPWTFALYSHILSRKSTYFDLFGRSVFWFSLIGHVPRDFNHRAFGSGLGIRANSMHALEGAAQNVPMLVKASWLLSVLYISSHQILFQLRFLPSIHVIGAAVATLALAARQNNKNTTSSTSGPVYEQLGLGFANALQHTLFIWSLLKLPPALPFAILLLYTPISYYLESTSGLAGLPLQVPGATAILTIVIGIYAPNDSYGFLQAFASLAINIAISRYDARKNANGASRSDKENTSNGGALAAVSAIPSALALQHFFGPSIFGARYLLPEPFPVFIISGILSVGAVTLAHSRNRDIWIRDSTAVAAAILVSKLVPGMRERIGWFDVFAFALIAAIDYWPADIPRQGPGHLNQSQTVWSAEPEEHALTGMLCALDLLVLSGPYIRINSTPRS